LGKIWKQNGNSIKNVNNKKYCQKFEITNFKEERLFLMSELIIIISTLNT